MSSSLVIDQSMAASLGSGSVSVLNYGNKIVALVLGMVAVSLSTVLFPRFSRLIAEGRMTDLAPYMIRAFSAPGLCDFAPRDCGLGDFLRTARKTCVRASAPSRRRPPRP